jgi:tRNA uridine 5-carboxymethylaminomethyl modification enzyme
MDYRIMFKTDITIDFYDVIIIGGGHAGCEAAAAAARVGSKTLLITLKESNLGEMSCNPAIGGIGKGTIVKEIDALDGIMSTAIDMAGIHFKMLNETRGPAVWGPRAQADRDLYKKAITSLLSNIKNLEILIDSVEDLVIENDRVRGVITSNGKIIYSSSVVLTTGTFLSGLIHIGERKIPAGRVGENPSYGLSATLRKHNFAVSRLKTGTPARLDGRSIKWHLLEEQKGDEIPRPFSFMNKIIKVPQISCFITETNAQTHEIIRENILKSPMYSGQIASRGPRYCPSIEDKIHRFAEKERHQIFLEPEGLNDHTIYPNGISTSLPEDIQERFIRSIKGLEEVIIIRPGYAIEYDFVDPRELKPTLETKKIENLFFAGQINGTTGYEEAAGQGIIAGANASLKALNREVFTISRADSYIGVMIDDLINLGTTEPYRMFTSRSEYRITLRADNADLRLTPLGIIYGLVGQEREEVFRQKLHELEACKNLLHSLNMSPNEADSFGIKITKDGVRRDAITLLSYNNIEYELLEKIWPQIKNFSQSIKDQIKIEAKYSHYLDKQKMDIDVFKKYENILIPNSIDYDYIKTLSSEIKEKLKLLTPQTIGAASRISGVTPAAIMSIIIHLKVNNTLKKMENA